MHLEKFGQKVLHQEIALDTYLSTLLDEIPSDILLDQVEIKKVKTKPVVKDQPVAKVALKQKQIVKPVEKEVVVPQTEIKAQVETIVNPLAIMPEWAQDDFQVLFFKVDKLILATPLTALLRTIKVDKKPTKIPGQPSWFMGLLDTHEQRIGVLDTGQLVFGKSIGQQRDLENNPFKSILITQDGRWGLACDEILTIGRLEPEKVRWRMVREKRPWLIGTVIDELTAIIDVKQLVPHRKAS